MTELFVTVHGILLPPAVAAVLMSASTVIVAINAQLLRRASRWLAPVASWRETCPKPCSRPVIRAEWFARSVS